VPGPSVQPSSSEASCRGYSLLLLFLILVLLLGVLAYCSSTLPPQKVVQLHHFDSLLVEDFAPGAGPFGGEYDLGIDFEVL